MAGKQQIPVYLCLAVVLLALVRLFRVHSDVFLILADDQLPVEVSRRAGAGEYSQLLAPHNVHWQLLFRLIRLYFDLHFPERFAGFHAAVLAAHGMSVGLVFLLSRRCLTSPWAALAAAAVFGWFTAGLGAFVEKAASFFVGLRRARSLRWLIEEVLRRGRSLAEVIDELAGRADIRSREGAWGILTRNLITRQHAFRDARVNALAPFLLSTPLFHR